MKTCICLLPFLLFIFLSCSDPKTGTHIEIVLDMDTMQVLRDFRNEKHYVAEKEKEIVSEALTYAKKTVEARLVKMGLESDQTEVTIMNGRIRVLIWSGKMKLDEKMRQRIFKTLQSSGKLELWETYFSSEIQGFIFSADTVISERVSNSSGLVASIPTPVIARLRVADTAAYMTDMRANPKIPDDVKWCWSLPNKETGEMELYALKGKSDGKGNYLPALSGNFITSARAESNSDYGNMVISFNMTSEGAMKWKMITASNVKRAIAIVFDNYVYSAPMVMAEIPNGSCQISGNFSKQESEDLAAILNSGGYAAPVKIVHTGFAEK